MNSLVSVVLMWMLLCFLLDMCVDRSRMVFSVNVVVVMNAILLVMVLCLLIGLFYWTRVVDYLWVIFRFYLVMFAFRVGRVSRLVFSVVSVILRSLFLCLIRFVVGMCIWCNWVMLFLMLCNFMNVLWFLMVIFGEFVFMMNVLMLLW